MLHAAVLRLPLPARITTTATTRPDPSLQEQAAELERTAARQGARARSLMPWPAEQRCGRSATSQATVHPSRLLAWSGLSR